MSDSPTTTGATPHCEGRVLRVIHPAQPAQRRTVKGACYE